MREFADELSMLWHHGCFTLQAVLVFGAMMFGVGILAGGVVILMVRP